MKRTTLSLPEELVAALAREARRRHTSVSQVAREAIESRFGRGITGTRRKIPFAALGNSGYATTSEDVEELLVEWARDYDRDR